MKRFALGASVTLWLMLSAWSASADFGEGVRLEADGEIIDVQVGHLVPCVTDWNNNGKLDLLVGNRTKGEKPSSGGNIWLFRGK